MILKVITDFHQDNKRNLTQGLKPLDHKDLDKRLTMASVSLPSVKVKELAKLCRNI